MPDLPSFNHYVVLKRRPNGVPNVGDFTLLSGPRPHPQEGEILVRNHYMSVDPYMRGRMIDRPSYAPPYQIGEVLEGGAVGQVLVSRNATFAEGDWVESNLGWREFFTARPEALKRLNPELGPIQAYLGALGMPGMTAYVGLLKVAELKPGERVFVSSAAGAVGSIACQIAKALGCTVVGSAGSDEKCRFLTEELKIDAAINYKTAANLSDALGAALPDGVDVYFDNVGGAHLEAALHHMRYKGRIACCGMIDIYNAAEAPPGPRNLSRIISRCLTVRGFLLPAYRDVEPEFLSAMAEWTKSGAVTWRETIHEGIERAPAALIGLFTGENIGKMLVKL